MTFQDFIDEGFGAVERLVFQRAEETHELEFKTKVNPLDLDLHKDDRRALGEAISGFANASGGMLIVGVRTHRPDGVDRAEEIQILKSVDQVLERYRAYVTVCAAPPVAGVQVASIKSSNDAGVIVIDIPKGNSRPHMSMAPSHQKYFRRVSDSFIPMQHYEIDEMMRLKASPELLPIFKFQQEGSINGINKASILFGLKNLSKFTAKFPYIGLKNAENIPRVAEYGLDGNGNTLWKKILSDASGSVIFSGGADMVLHPGQALYVSKLEYLDRRLERFERYWSVDNLVEDRSINLLFDYGCEDTSLRTHTLTLNRSNLIEHTFE